MVDEQDSMRFALDEAYGTAAGTVNLNFDITEGDDSQVVYAPEEGGFHTAFSDGNNLLVRTRGSKTGAFGKKTGFKAPYNINQTAERKAYQLNLEKTADEPVVRYATVLLPTSRRLGRDGSIITLGELGRRAAVRSACRSGAFPILRCPIPCNLKTAITYEIPAFSNVCFAALTALCAVGARGLRRRRYRERRPAALLLSDGRGHRSLR